MNDEASQLLTVAEISAYLRIGTESIRRWLREGKLTGINLGRGSGWRVRRADLAQLLADKGGVPQSQAGSAVVAASNRVREDILPEAPVAVHVTSVTKLPLQNHQTGVTHLAMVIASGLERKLSRQ